MKLLKDFIFTITALALCFVFMCIFGSCSQPCNSSSDEVVYTATGYVCTYMSEPNTILGFKSDDGDVYFFNDADYMEKEKGYHLKISYTYTDSMKTYITLVSWDYCD